MIPWIARPQQTEPQIRNWARRYADRLELDQVRPWTHTVYALTVTDPQTAEEAKRRCLVSVPHAHEPAGTVACMNFLSQLLEGRELDGTPTTLDREAILRETILTFIPDGNPEGRSRAPLDWWDGTQVTNEEFLKIAFGSDAETGARFRRVDRWRTTEFTPARIGIAYERIDAVTYVEPNRDWGSSYFRLFHALRERYRYDQILELHQTEFEDSPNNAVTLLPVLWDELPEAIRRTAGAWAEAITAAWRGMESAAPQAPYPLGYTGPQRAYFVARWGDVYRSVPTINVEVQNNNQRTPPDLQRRIAETAIRVSVERLLNATR
jgi:hypothetical protein